MAKKRDEKPRREVTKRQLSHWQQQRKKQRIVLSVGTFIIASVLVVIGVGWYVSHYQPLHQTVIKVNDVEFNMDYYIKMLRFHGKDQSVEYRYYLADKVVQRIEQDELIRQGAVKLGISVSDDEVKDELKSRELPLSRDYRDLVGVELLANKLLDNYFDEEVPQFAEQRHVMAMFVESESQAIEVRDRLEDGEDFGELAGELSLDSFSRAAKGDLDWHPQDILADVLATSVPGEHAFGAEVEVLSEPIYDEDKFKGVGYWLIEVLERDEEPDEAHVQAVLLGSEEEAQQVRSRLEAGEDFATLVEEYSQYEYSDEETGDLGWLSPGEMSSVFDEFVFNSELELETLSQPIRDDATLTKGGYWLVRVLGEDDNREIGEDDRDFLKAQVFNEWLSLLWDDPENQIDSYLDSEQKTWAVEQSMKG